MVRGALPSLRSLKKVVLPTPCAAQNSAMESASGPADGMSRPARARFRSDKAGPASTEKPFEPASYMNYVKSQQNRTLGNTGGPVRRFEMTMQRALDAVFMEAA